VLLPRITPVLVLVRVLMVLLLLYPPIVALLLRDTVIVLIVVTDCASADGVIAAKADNKDTVKIVCFGSRKSRDVCWRRTVVIGSFRIYFLWRREMCRLMRQRNPLVKSGNETYVLNIQ